MGFYTKPTYTLTGRFIQWVRIIFLILCTISNFLVSSDTTASSQSRPAWRSLHGCIISNGKQTQTWCPTEWELLTEHINQSSLASRFTSAFGWLPATCSLVLLLLAPPTAPSLVRHFTLLSLTHITTHKFLIKSCFVATVLQMFPLKRTKFEEKALRVIFPLQYQVWPLGDKAAVWRHHQCSRVFAGFRRDWGEVHLHN